LPELVLLIELIDVIVPNEFEAEILSGVPVTDEKSMAQNADYFLSLGAKVTGTPDNISASNSFGTITSINSNNS
jgi:pyridoxal/pyridoxine/pyridoxamine kinase